MQIVFRSATLVVLLMLGSPVMAQFGIPRPSATKIQPRIPTTPNRPLVAPNQVQPQGTRAGNIAIDTNPQPVTLPSNPRPGTVSPNTVRPGTSRPGTIGVQTKPSTSPNTAPKTSPPKITPPKFTPPKFRF